MRKDAGVTAIELIVVIAIIGTLTAIGVPNYLIYKSNYSLKGAVSTLRGDLHGTKMLAIKRGVEYRVVFTASGYTIQRGNKSSGSDAWTVEFTKDFSEYEGVYVESSTGDPIFSPKGTVAPPPSRHYFENW